MSRHYSWHHAISVVMKHQEVGALLMCVNAGGMTTVELSRKDTRLKQVCEGLKMLSEGRSLMPAIEQVTLSVEHARLLENAASILVQQTMKEAKNSMPDREYQKLMKNLMRIEAARKELNDQLNRWAVNRLQKQG